MDSPAARDLLLRLLLAADEGELGSAQAVKGCALFGISENNARVALARLVTAGLAEGVGRGAYRLGPQATDWARELCRQVGHERMLWASDCPFVGMESSVSYQDTLDWLAQVVPDARERERVGSTNPLAFYFNLPAAA